MSRARRKGKSTSADSSEPPMPMTVIAPVPKAVAEPVQHAPRAPGLDVSMAVEEIVEISLLKVHAERRPGPLPDQFSPVIRRSSKDYTIEDPNHLKLRPTFTLLVHAAAQAAEADEDYLAKIEATFEISYRIDNVARFGQQSLSAFARLNGLFNVWPYWRELVQSTVTRLGLPPFTVPPFQPQKAVKNAVAAPPPARVEDEGSTT